MKVDVTLYSPLKEFSGVSSVALRLPEPATAEELLQQLGGHYPALRPFLPNVQVVLNKELVHSLHLLHDGDTVELRVPMFGG